MTRLLSLFGLMRVSEHEARVDETRILTGSRNHWRSRALEAEGRFKQAVADLEKQAGEIATLNEEAEHLKAELWAATEQARDNVTDAQKWRDRAERERQRGYVRRAGASK